MFVFLRSVIRFISLLAFLFSLLEFAISFNGWVMIQPNLTAISAIRVEQSKIRVERSKQQLDESKAGKIPSDNVRLENIEYDVGYLGEIAIDIHETIELSLSLIALILSLILVLTAWRPESIYDHKT